MWTQDFPILLHHWQGLLIGLLWRCSPVLISVFATTTNHILYFWVWFNILYYLKYSWKPGTLEWMSFYVSVYACVCACVCACARACVRVSACSLTLAASCCRCPCRSQTPSNEGCLLIICLFALAELFDRLSSISMFQPPPAFAPSSLPSSAA